MGKIKIREQLLKDFPPKELRGIIDQGKKEIKSGIIICISTLRIKLVWLWVFLKILLQSMMQLI